MAPRVRPSKLETRSARLRLARRKEPYYETIMRGVQVGWGYRRNKTAGPFNWHDTRDGVDLTEFLGLADDYLGEELERPRVVVRRVEDDLAVRP